MSANQAGDVRQSVVDWLSFWLRAPQIESICSAPALPDMCGQERSIVIAYAMRDRPRSRQCSTLTLRSTSYRHVSAISPTGCRRRPVSFRPQIVARSLPYDGTSNRRQLAFRQALVRLQANKGEKRTQDGATSYLGPAMLGSFALSHRIKIARYAQPRPAEMATRPRA